MVVLMRFIISLVFVSWMSLVQASTEEDIWQTYSHFLDGFSGDLASKSELYKESPDTYWAMVQQRVLPLWSKKASIEGLATRAKLDDLSPTQRQQLDAVLDATVQRYAFEILDNYSGQRFVLNKLVRDDEFPEFAVLEITAVWDNFPDLDIELMLINEDDQWRFYNIRYGWFSYIGAKKWSYRRGLVSARFDSFLEGLANKNRRHFAAMCAATLVQTSQICHEWIGDQ